MKINIEAVHIDVNEELSELIDRKVTRLGKFYERIVDVDVYLKNVNDPRHGAVAELRVNVPNDTLYCEEKGANHGEAIDKASHAMERLIKKFKDRHADSPLRR